MPLIFDIETNGLWHDCTVVHCIGILDLETGFSQGYHGATLAAGLDRLEKADLLIGHNIIKFDLPVLIHKMGRPALANVPRFDTLIASQLIWTDLADLDFGYIKKHPEFPKQLVGRHGLKAWGHRLGCLKGDFGEQNDWSAFSPEMLVYCLQDLQVTAALYKRIQSKNWSEASLALEFGFAEVIARLEHHGVMFDTPKASQLYAALVAQREKLVQALQASCEGWYSPMKLPQYYEAGGKRYPTKGAARKAKHRDADIVAGPLRKKHEPFNPSSREHIARLFKQRYNWKPTVFTPDGRPALDEPILAGLPYPEARQLEDYLLLDKRIGQLAEGAKAWMKLVRPDGRIYGEITTNGAVTGRCTHKNPNLAQVPKVGSPHGKECRALFIPGPGKVLVGCDASGLELRMLSHYMACYDRGEYAKIVTEGDVHTFNQKAAGLPTRDNAKTFIYGWLYGAGDEKIGKITGKGKAEGAKLKKQFLAAIPAVAKLKEGIARAVAERGHLRGLDGRLLKVRSAHSALNTLLQSAGALVVKQATVLFARRCAAEGLPVSIVLHVHDEWQTECSPADAERVGTIAVESIKAAGEHFKLRCPLTGEYKIGDSWAATH